MPSFTVMRVTPAWNRCGSASAEDVPAPSKEIARRKVCLFMGRPYALENIGFKRPKFLKQGDVIAMKVDGIGRLSNPVQ